MKEDILTQYSQLFGQFNKETKEHSLSVAVICECVGRCLDLNPRICYKIGLLHDVGKIFIPSRILKKNMKLTDFEREVVDLHAYFGYRILREKGEESDIYIPVLFHHGFKKPRLYEPDEQISDYLLTLIHMIHTVDIYDAMTRKRVYHDSYDKEKVFHTLEEDSMCTEDITDILRKMNPNPVQRINI